MSKVAQDLMGWQYFKSYGMHVVRARAFNHTGPRRGDAFAESNFAKQIAEMEAGLREPVVHVGDLKPTRDFSDVRDIVRGYWLLLERGTPGEVYNLCSGLEWSIERLLNFLIDKSTVSHHRDSSGSGAAAPLRRTGPARLTAEGRERARLAHDDPARADAHGSARVLASPDRVTPALAGAALVPGARVALVHDWLTGMRGGERCLEVFCELFPDAPLFTLLHVPGSVTPTIERRRIVTSFVQRLPQAAARYRYYFPVFPLAIGRFDLSEYDLVVSMSHCVAKGVRVSPHALHLCYCFSPMRYVWDLSSDYFGPGRSGRSHARAAAGGGAQALGPEDGRRATDSWRSRGTSPTGSGAYTSVRRT